jgi:hypothetical protein
MRLKGRRWLCILGTVTAATVGWALGQGAAVGAAPAMPAGRADPARAAAVVSVPRQVILRPGMHGGTVTALQRRLARLHYHPGPADYPCPGGGTCGPAITPAGNYRAHRFTPGWLRVPLGRMYSPVFFIGALYAIHGDSPVPLRTAVCGSPWTSPGSSTS